MNDVTEPIDRHLDDEEIVALFDGTAGADAQAHLLVCESCRLLYETSGAVHAEDLGLRSERKVRKGRRGWIVAAGGLAVAATILVALLPLGTPPSRPDLRADLPPELLPWAERVTGQWMIVPGFEDVAARGIPLQRSFEAEPDHAGQAVDAALDRMRADDVRVTDYVRGIGTLVAAGDLAAARRWALHARATHDDARIAFLSALTAQLTGDFDAAIAELDVACADGAGPSTLCANLALVLGQIGRVDEAREVLRWLEESDVEETVLERVRAGVGE